MEVSAETWSWIAAVASVIGLWISGQNPRWGWIYGIGCQGLWLTYGLVTDQSGMIALSFVFVALYVRNIRRWSGAALVPVERRTQADRAVVLESKVAS